MKNFSQEELIRYNRHLILSEIGLEGQRKLKAAKILVIGAGGLGCPILQYLAATELITDILELIVLTVVEMWSQSSPQLA